MDTALDIPSWFVVTVCTEIDNIEYGPVVLVRNLDLGKSPWYSLIVLVDEGDMFIKNFPPIWIHL